MSILNMGPSIQNFDCNFRPLGGVLDGVGRPSPSYHLEIGQGGYAGERPPRGTLSHFGFLEPAAQNAGCSCVVGLAHGPQTFLWAYLCFSCFFGASRPRLDPLWTPSRRPLELSGPPLDLLRIAPSLPSKTKPESLTAMLRPCGWGLEMWLS